MKEYAVQISTDGEVTWTTIEYGSFLDDPTIVRHGAFKNRTAQECADNLLDRKNDELLEEQKRGCKVYRAEDIAPAQRWVDRVFSTKYRIAVREVTEWSEWYWGM